MRPRVLNVIAVVLGVGIAVSLITASVLLAPLVILPSGASRTVPGSEFDPAAGNWPGLVRINFTLNLNSNLTGILTSTEPFSAVVTNSNSGLAVLCFVSEPPIPCATVSGDWFAYSDRVSVDLASPDNSRGGKPIACPPVAGRSTSSIGIRGL
jgi:hypothetical protein